MLTQDLRYGWRLLVRKPGFAAVAIVTLGVGIGANITVFSLMNAVLLRPLASYEPGRVVRISGRTASGTPLARFSFPDFAAFRERSTVLTDLSGANLGSFVLTIDNGTEQILGEIVSGRYLSMLGARVTAVARCLTRTIESPPLRSWSSARPFASAALAPIPR